MEGKKLLRSDFLITKAWQNPFNKGKKTSITFSVLFKPTSNYHLPRCRQCKKVIPLEKSYRKEGGYDKRTKSWNKCYCLGCVAWYMSRYSFLRIKHPTQYEYTLANQLLKEWVDSRLWIDDVRQEEEISV